MFNAACRLARVEPNILLESRAPHTLLALAEAGQGVAIIPSLLRTDRYTLKIVRVTHRRKPLRERLVIQWDKRRPMPPYAESFCEALAEYMREVLPITQPSEGKIGRRTEASCCPKTSQAHRPRLKGPLRVKSGKTLREHITVRCGPKADFRSAIYEYTPLVQRTPDAGSARTFRHVDGTAANCLRSAVRRPGWRWASKRRRRKHNA